MLAGGGGTWDGTDGPSARAGPRIVGRAAPGVRTAPSATPRANPRTSSGRAKLA